ncbi:SGNH/GDSL hydrolase family protein [Planctomicrobium sp. SH668]|uniref:SGNH/GDSL hydrolase family protein n=1 Tax=Planctomicrobium sp. SH668 TaxID=3448126 RepID=UPI003F5CAC44
MKLFHWAFIALFTLPIHQVFGQQSDSNRRDDRAVSKVELNDGDSFVFLGDSITHQCLYTQYVENYFYTHFPQLRLNIHNAGVSGARAWDALARFDQDVASYKPKYVTILLGMNDASYRPYDEATFQTYSKDMSEVIAKIQAIGAQPIPMSPTMYDARAMRANNYRNFNEETNSLYNSVLAFYGAWLREVAFEKKLNFVDMHTPLNQLTSQQRETDPSFTLIRDAIHPDAPGQVVMAVSLLSDLHMPGLVSSIQIQKNADGTWTATGENGEITDLNVDHDSEISFNFQAKSLPWVLPENARLGVDLTYAGHRLSREAFQVSGLPVGEYELKIDGQAVGQYSSAELAVGIELEDNPLTPQHQQAAKVAELNAKRNQAHIAALRLEWFQFQEFARLKQRSESEPDNKELEATLAQLTEHIKSIQSRVDVHNANAKLIEDEIFTINQPKNSHYTLSSVR